QRPHVGVRRERRQPLALLAFEGGRVLGALRRRRAHDARHRGRGSDRRRPGSAGDRRRGHGTRGCLTAWSDEGGSGPRGSLPAMTATGATEKRIDATTELPAESGANGKAEQVRSMFSDIAPTYDLLNTVLSFGIDARWRAQAAREALPPDLLVAAGEAGAGSDRAVLDVATGTGNLALALKRRCAACRVVGVDFAEPMLARAREKARRAGVDATFAVADGSALPYDDGTFDAVTIAYGLRNFA